MCTAITYQTRDHYFGRNLDLEFSYHETVTITPRNFPFHFRKLQPIQHHYAMIGMATVAENYPLYYEATNEKGLSIAGLNFPGNAVYNEVDEDLESVDNVMPFELIPWILGQCADLCDVRKLLKRLNLANLAFSEEYPLAPLHWMISDRTGSYVLETVQTGMMVYENPVGILTNNPPFDFQVTNLCNYLNLSREIPVNRFAEDLLLNPYSRGMGAMGLPGDLSSVSRFVRAAFVKWNSVLDRSEECSELASVGQFFHILGSVEQQRGCVRLGEHEYELTLYSSCCNTDKGIYYYKTYENSQITAVDMRRENLDGERLVLYPLITGQQVRWEN